MRRTCAVAVAAIALGGLAASANAAPWGNSDPQAVCHATGSASNPYVLINPSAKGAAKGHAADAKQGPSTRRAAQPHYSATCPGGGGGGGGEDPGGSF